jgi:hypothetical protein
MSDCMLGDAVSNVCAANCNDGHSLRFSPPALVEISSFVLVHPNTCVDVLSIELAIGIIAVAVNGPRSVEKMSALQSSQYHFYILRLPGTPQRSLKNCIQSMVVHLLQNACKLLYVHNSVNLFELVIAPSRIIAGWRALGL